MKKTLFGLIALLSIAAAYFFADSFSTFGFSLAVLPILANATRQELENIIEQHMSNSFAGDEDDDFSGFEDLDENDLYDGFEDDELSFIGAAKSFLDEKKNGVYISFKVINNSGYSKVVCLNPAFFNTLSMNPEEMMRIAKGTPLKGSSNMTYALAQRNKIFQYCNTEEMNASGHMVDAVITDGTIFYNQGMTDPMTGEYIPDTKNTISCQSINGKIIDHLNFIKKNPTRVPEMVISSTKTSTGATDTTQYSKIMIMRQVSAYRKFGDTNIDLNDFFKVEQFQSGKIVIPTANYNLQLDNQTLLLLEIDNDITLNFTFKIGAISNDSSKLFNKATKAHRNISLGTAGQVAPQVVKARKALANKQNAMLRTLQFGKKK